MKSTLNLKFIFLYVVFAFLSIFAVSALSSPLITSYLEEKLAENLYQDATLTATEYLPNYFDEKLDTSDIYMHLRGMSSYTNATIWFVDRTGEMISFAKADENLKVPVRIENFNPTELGSKQYIIGDYHGYFPEDVITVLVPVTKNFSIRGYLIVHQAYSYIEDFRFPLIRNVFFIVVCVILLSLVIFIGLIFFVFRPLRKVTDAALEYASGNLDVKIPVNTQDEMGYLSASLNYMSSQLKDMEDYQKKFVANVSHDFRSPLTSIKGYVEAIADGTIPPEFQEKYLKIILFETERLTDLTQDLLTLNEFDTKELLLNRTSFDIHEIIRNVAASFEGVCISKKISIDLLFASRSLDVYADKSKIQQVLYNLLDNAIKFSDNDSSIIIETTERSEKIFISVKDYGIGIPRASLNKIWERFYKTDRSRGKDKKGTGLGLAIVKEIIQAHHENINVLSTEGVGTEFVFSLPKTKKGMLN